MTDHIARQQPAERPRRGALAVLRARTHDIPLSRLAMLRRIPGLTGLPDASLARLDALSCELDVEVGTPLTTQGHAGRQVLVVVTGTAEITRDGAVVGYARAGDILGELSLLSGAPQNASAGAVTPMRVLALEPRQFATVFSGAQLARWVAATLSARHPRICASAVGYRAAG